VHPTALATCSRPDLFDRLPEYSGNHLSDEFYDALCRLGGRLTQLALDKPEVFNTELPQG